MEHSLLALVAQPGAGHPARRDIDHSQRVQELTSATPAAVRHQVHLEEPGPRIRPIGKGANENLPFEQRAGFGGADAAPRLGLLAQRLECTIHGGRTHAGDTRLDRNRELA
jgi:hypothetical protein